MKAALQLIVVQQDEDAQEDDEPVARLVGKHGLLQLFEGHVTQRLKDSLREDGAHLVVDERWDLDYGVAVVTVRETLRAKSVVPSAAPTALQESTCHPDAKHIG